MALSGCGADASELDGWAGAPRPAAYDAAIIGQAEQDLKLHDVRRARARYTEALATQDPRVEGTAAAGKAVTELMLLPGSAAVRELVVEQLGAQNRSYDVQRLIWSDSGALYWFEQGVRWEDDGEFEGVRSIVSGDLPWSLERLDAADVFVAGLDQPGDRIAEALVAIADELRPLEQDLQTAIFDPKFEYLYLPSEVFHHDAMSMALGKSELAAIHGVVSLARSGAYLVAAYRHPWTLEEAFTPAAPGVAPIDHAAPYLDPLLGRQLVGEDPQDTLRRARLNEARLAARNGLSFLHTSISLGLESEVLEISPLRWDRVDRDLGYDLVDILQALENAVDGPAKIPHATDDLFVDLSVFFEGRVLDPQISWFERAPAQAEGEDAPVVGALWSKLGGWQLTDEATQAFFLDGVFDPPAQVGQDYPIELELPEERRERFLEDLLDPLVKRIEEAY